MTIRDEAIEVLHELAHRATAASAGAHSEPAPLGPADDLAHALVDPSIGRAGVAALLDVLVRAVGRHPSLAQTAARLAVATELELGGPAAAVDLFGAWQAVRAVHPADVRDAVLAARALTAVGRYGDALGELAPLDMANRRVLAASLIPLAATGRVDEALRRHRCDVGELRHDRHALAETAAHVDLLRLTGNGAAAVELVLHGVPLLRAGADASARCRWLIAAAHATAEQVAAGHGADLVTVAWPRRPVEPVTLTVFAAVLHGRAAAAASSFDVRCGDGGELGPRGHDLADPDRHSVVRHHTARAAEVAADSPRRRPVVRDADVLGAADPLAVVEDALLAQTLAEPVSVCAALVLRLSGRPDEAAARDLLARALVTSGDTVRCLAEAITAEALFRARGDQLGVGSARVTSAAAVVGTDPARGLDLAEAALADLAAVPVGEARAAVDCRARSVVVSALLALGTPEATGRWLREMTAVHPGQQVRVGVLRAAALRDQGLLGEAVDVLIGVEAVADRAGLVALGVSVRAELAELLARVNRFDDAADRLTRAIDELLAGPDVVPDGEPLDLACLRLELGRVLATAGRWDTAQAALDAAHAELEHVADPGDALATARHWLGVVLRGRGEPTRALVELDRAAAGFVELGRPDAAALVHRDRGALLFELHRDHESAAAFDAAAGHARTAGHTWAALVHGIDAAQARCHARIADPAAELRELRTQLPLVPDVDPTELRLQLARVEHALARCLLMDGDVAGAAATAEIALAGYRDAGAVRAVVALSIDAGLWWAQAGDLGSARCYAEAGVRGASTLGDPRLAAQARRTWSEVTRITQETNTDGDNDGQEITLPRQP